MADAAGVFPTTLLILYFITPPAHLPPGESKKDQEINATWTLQATSQITTQDPITCASLAKLMIAEFDPVNTTAVRTYCLCPHGNGSNLCFNEEEFQTMIQEFSRGKSKGPPPGPAVQRIGPLTKVPSAVSTPNAGGTAK
jgi:hypothetical protein